MVLGRCLRNTLRFYEIPLGPGRTQARPQMGPNWAQWARIGPNGPKSGPMGPGPGPDPGPAPNGPNRAQWAQIGPNGPGTRAGPRPTPGDDDGDGGGDGGRISQPHPTPHLITPRDSITRSGTPHSDQQKQNIGKQPIGKQHTTYWKTTY